jgi:hypothetical protein
MTNSIALEINGITNIIKIRFNMGIVKDMLWKSAFILLFSIIWVLNEGFMYNLEILLWHYLLLHTIKKKCEWENWWWKIKSKFIIHKFYLKQISLYSYLHIPNMKWTIFPFLNILINTYIYTHFEHFAYIYFISYVYMILVHSTNTTSCHNS